MLRVYRSRLEEKEISLFKASLAKAQYSQGRVCISNVSNYKNSLLMSPKRKAANDAVYRPNICQYDKVSSSYQYSHPVKKAAWSKFSVTAVEAKRPTTSCEGLMKTLVIRNAGSQLNDYRSSYKANA